MKKLQQNVQDPGHCHGPTYVESVFPISLLTRQPTPPQVQTVWSHGSVLLLLLYYRPKFFAPPLPVTVSSCL